jgi:hypothetical protein
MIIKGLLEAIEDLWEVLQPKTYPIQLTAEEQ